MTSEQETTDWRPMSEAPRTGETRILLALPRREEPIVIGFWSAWNMWWTSGEIDRAHDHTALPAPFAWMPLPKLPHKADPSQPEAANG